MILTNTLMLDAGEEAASSNSEYQIYSSWVKTKPPYSFFNAVEMSNHLTVNDVEPTLVSHPKVQGEMPSVLLKPYFFMLKSWSNRAI